MTSKLCPESIDGFWAGRWGVCKEGRRGGTGVGEKTHHWCQFLRRAKGTKRVSTRI